MVVDGKRESWKEKCGRRGDGYIIYIIGGKRDISDKTRRAP